MLFFNRAFKAIYKTYVSRLEALKALDKWTIKSTQVNASFRLDCVQFAFRLAACVDVDWARIRRRKSTHVFQRLATQRKSTQVDRKSTVYAWNKCATLCNLCEIASRLANPFGHPSQVRTQVLVLQTCVDLQRLESPFGQSFISWTDFVFLQLSNWQRTLNRIFKRYGSFFVQLAR